MLPVLPCGTFLLESALSSIEVTIIPDCPYVPGVAPGIVKISWAGCAPFLLVYCHSPLRPLPPGIPANEKIRLAYGSIWLATNTIDCGVENVNMALRVIEVPATDTTVTPPVPYRSWPGVIPVAEATVTTSVPVPAVTLVVTSCPKLTVTLSAVALVTTILYRFPVSQLYPVHHIWTPGRAYSPSATPEVAKLIECGVIEVIVYVPFKAEVEDPATIHWAPT